MRLIEKILKQASSINPLPFELLESIDDWVLQSSLYDESIVFNVQQNCAKFLPNEFKEAPKFIFRAVVVPKNLDFKFKSGIRSWCSNVSKTENFASDLKFDSKKQVLCILKIATDSSRVLCNLSKLGNSKIFKQSVKYWLKKKKNFSSALNLLIDEDEIIYEQPIITKRNIFSILSNDGYEWEKFK